MYSGGEEGKGGGCSGRGLGYRGGGSGDHREADCSKANRGDLALFPLAAVSKCPGWEAANKEEEEILEVGGGEGWDTSHRCNITTGFQTGSMVTCQFFFSAKKNPTLPNSIFVID